MLLACIIKAGLGQQPIFPVHYGIIDRARGTDEDLDALLCKCLDGLRPKAAHYHNLNSLIFEHIRWQAFATHMITPVGQDMHLLGIEIHQRECGSPPEVLRNGLFHSTVAHGGYTDLHLITAAHHRFSRSPGHRLILGPGSPHPGHVLLRLCPSRLRNLHVPCQHGAEQMRR